MKIHKTYKVNENVNLFLSHSINKAIKMWYCWKIVEVPVRWQQILMEHCQYHCSSSIAALGSLMAAMSGTTGVTTAVTHLLSFPNTWPRPWEVIAAVITSLQVNLHYTNT
jgi:hypothetical protein